MDIQIRTEKLLNNSTVTNLNQEAFHGENAYGEFGSESLGTEQTEQLHNCDPCLSLLAEIAGEGSGHVLYSIYQFTVAGMAQQSALLATVSMRQRFGRKGIKTLLINPEIVWTHYSEVEKAA